MPHHQVLKFKHPIQQSLSCFKSLLINECRYFASTSKNSQNFKEPANNDDLNKSRDVRIKLVKMEHELVRASGSKCPTSLSDAHIEELLEMPTRSQRLKFFNFLFTKEMHIKKDEKMKIKKQQAIAERYAERLRQREECHIEYGLGRNSIFHQIRDSSIHLLNAYKLAEGAMFGSKLVFDLGYDEYMNKKDANNAAIQLKYSFAHNKVSDSPFHIHFCNTFYEGITFKSFFKMNPNINSPHFITEVTERSYLDLFPKEKLVYLTPNAHEELKTFDHDAVYIIGSYVDMRVSKPISFAKAKREGLRMCKFPLDRYLRWGAGSGKSLTIDQSLQIMLDLKNCNDWQYALRHVPRRKLVKENNFSST